MHKSRVTRFICFFITCLILCFAGCVRESNTFVAVTWNLRGYPEKEQANRQWFHRQLVEMNPKMLCIQEIAEQDKDRPGRRGSYKKLALPIDETVQ